MSGLQELRDQIAKDEEQESVEKVEEPILEEEVDEESVETEPSEDESTDEVDEIDLSLDDEEDKQRKPTPEQALVFKLTKEKKKRQEATSELERLKAENEALKSGQYRAPQNTVAAQNGYPPVPVLYEDGVNTKEDYQRAYSNWVERCRQIDQERAQTQQLSADVQRQNQERASRLAERASGFIKTNKIKADNAIETIQSGIHGLDEALGVEGVALDLLDTIGEGSERLAYYLGRNPEALATAKRLFNEDKRGFKVNTWLANTAFKLNQKNTKHISKAPAPDAPLTPDGSSVTAAALQSQYDKETDFSKLRELSRKARELGIKLN